MTRRFLGRIRILTLLFIFAAVVIVGRLYLLQIVHGQSYAARADAQFTPQSSPLLDRGAIYFTDKNNTQITAATLKTGYAIALNPSKVVDPALLYAALKDYTSLDEETFIAKATKKGSQYQLVAQHLSDEQGMEIQTKQLPGVILQQDHWRLYPGGSLAAQQLGFVAYNADDRQEGRYGLERFYNNTLERPESDLYKNFFVELFGGVQTALEGGARQGDLITTIEPSVQAELERQLLEYAKHWSPKLAGGIIMNPQNGEIYAMALHPTFDLNSFNTQTDPLIYANPLVQNVYEMGSIIKPLTMAAGIDSGVVTEETVYNDQGCITVDTKKICNFDFKARGTIPMQEVLSQSLNLGVSFVATKMGKDVMQDYFLERYKIGSTTSIDLPGEVNGIVGNLKSPRQVEYNTASFGQGIAMTPIATVRALSVLANGGYLVQPHVVRSVRYTTGITDTLAWGEKVQVIKPQTATVVSRMLTKVVDDALTQGKYKIDHYSVAAKTGTAQIANPAGGGYYSDRFLHSFFGYFPSYNAQFVIFLFAVEPVGAPYASTTLAPPWHTLTQFLINYYNVQPDR